MNPILDVALRSLAVYFFMVFAIRLFGKNQLSQLNAGDVVLLLLISNAVQNAMVGENTSLQGGIAAALVLFAANFLVKKFTFKNQTFKKLIESEPEVLVKDGIIENLTLQREEISLDELNETIREHGVEKVADVKLAILEVDGSISVISLNGSQQTHFTHHKQKYPRRIHKF